jgi:hypothetical protein
MIKHKPIKRSDPARKTKASFHAVEKRRLARMKKSGEAIPADEVFDFLRDRVGDYKRHDQKFARCRYHTMPGKPRQLDFYSHSVFRDLNQACVR